MDKEQREAMQEQISSLRESIHKLEMQLAVFTSQLRAIQDGLSDHVSVKEFRPVQLIAFGLVSVIMTSLVGAIVAMALMHK